MQCKFQWSKQFMVHNVNAYLGDEAEILEFRGRREWGSRAQGTDSERGWISATDLDDFFLTQFLPPFCFLLYLSLPQLRAPPAHLSSPASPGWVEAWNQESPSWVWSLALLLTRMRQRIIQDVQAICCWFYFLCNFEFYGLFISCFML